MDYYIIEDRASNAKQNKNLASDPALNVWVSASAGSGKTKLLVDRYLRLLMNGSDFKKILCITFTKLAAKEMILRISKELQSWESMHYEDLQLNLEKLLGFKPHDSQIDRARSLFSTFLKQSSDLQIQTIHSFCQSIINDSRNSLDLNTKKILSEVEKSHLIKMSKREIIENNSDDLIGSLIDDLHDMTFESLLDDAIFFNSMVYIDSEHEKKSYIELIEKELGVQNLESESVLENLEAQIAKHKNKLHLLSEFHVNFENDCRAIDANKFATLQNSFLTKEGQPRKKLLPKAKADANPEMQGLLEILQQYVFECAERLKSIAIAKSTIGFVNLAFEFRKIYTKHKKQENAIDYDDLIKGSIYLLNESEKSDWIKYRISQRLSHILIDEAQDVSSKQWMVILLCMSDFFVEDNGKTFFAVGDEKQSIYSFQGASTDIFLNMQKYIRNLTRECSNNLHEIKLEQSFRSSKKILNFVDAVFHEVHDLNHSYFAITHHKSKIDFPNSSIELWPLVEAEAQPGYDPLEIFSDYLNTKNPTEILAEQIAHKVHDLIHNHKIKEEEIMILVRKRDKLMEDIITAFKKKGISTSGFDKLNLSRHLAAQDLIAAAKFILLPGDDYNLACLMKSPILQITEEELLQLCQRGELSIWENLQRIKNTNSKFDNAYLMLNELLSNTDLHTPYNLFFHILYTLKMKTEFLSCFGMHIEEVLDQILKIALDFESEDFSLTKFTDYFENSDIEMKSSPKDNQVKVMTAHSSKGLESKVVILPDTTSLPTNKGGAVFDLENGFVIYQNDSANRNNIYKEKIAAHKTKTMQEYYRLLYVALTRASEHLIICGCANAQTVPEESWYSVMKKAFEKNHA